MSTKRLRCLYGDVKKSIQKRRAGNLALKKQPMLDIGEAIGVKTPTAEVYILDAYVAGCPIDPEYIVQELKVDRELFHSVKREIASHEEITLRTIKDNLADRDLSYNQIRCIIACLINGYELP